MKTLLSLSALVVLSQLLTNTSQASYIVNGSFENGIDGWNIFAEGGVFLSENEPYDQLYTFEHPLKNLDQIYYGASINDPSGYGKIERIETSPTTLPGAIGSMLDLSGFGSETFWFEAPDGTGWTFVPDAHYAFEPYIHLGLTQTLDLQAGQIVSGWSRFFTSDYANFDYDRAFVTIGDEEVWENSVLDVWKGWDDQNLRRYSEGEWSQWSWQAPADGSYLLSLKITTDDQEGSWSNFDNITVSGPQPMRVPDGGSTAILILGTVPLLFGLRRFVANSR